MKVQDVLRYDDVMKNLIDNTTMDSKIKFRFLNMRKQFEPIVNNFQQMREEILQKHSERRDDGVVGIFAPTEPVEPKRDDFETDEAFDNATKDYKIAVAEYPKKVEAFQKIVGEFNKELDPILNDDANIEFTKFKADEIMNAGIDSDALLVIYELIEV